MNEKERISAIEVALNNELREREFYLKNAQRTKNPLGKKMFQQIGDEELEHYQRLKQLHETWEKQKKWPGTLPLEVNGTIVKDVLKDFLKHVNKKKEGDDSDLKAVRTAIEFEAKGAKFYAELRDAVSDSGEGFFRSPRKDRERALSVVKGHRRIFYRCPVWFRKAEHHSLDGG